MLWKNESGATAIEYALITAMIALAIIAAITLIGTDVSSVFSSVSTEL